MAIGGRYLELHNNRPFLNRKSSFFRSISTCIVSAFSVEKFKKQLAFVLQFATYPEAMYIAL